jgi:hypothetical protein
LHTAALIRHRFPYGGIYRDHQIAATVSLKASLKGDLTRLKCAFSSLVNGRNLTQPER